MSRRRIRESQRRPLGLPGVAALALLSVALPMVVLSVALAACQTAATDPGTPGESVTIGDLSVTGTWVRAGLAGKTTAAYMTIANAGAQPDRLLSAAAEIADDVQVHTTRMEGGMMQMVHLEDGLEIPAEGETALAPEGNHLMLIGLARDLSEGETVDLTLVFEEAGAILVSAEVLPMASMGPEKDD